MYSATHNTCLRLVVIASTCVAITVPSTRRCAAQSATALPAKSTEQRHAFLPHGDFFTPLIADNKEPRFFASLQHARLQGLGTDPGSDGVLAAVVGLGTTFGLWRYITEQQTGIQASVFAAAFSQFNMDTLSNDLINTDYLVGIPISFRSGPISARARLYHQSSHLGDEFLLNSAVADGNLSRVDLSFEVVDMLLAYTHRHFRLYGGGGYIVRTKTDLEPAMLQGGAELGYPEWTRLQALNLWIDPVAAVDVSILEARRWETNTSVKMGLSFRGDRGKAFRVLLVGLKGFVPYGQFFLTEEVWSLGMELQFER